MLSPIRYLLPVLAIILLSPSPVLAQEKQSKAAFEIDLSQGLAPETTVALGKELGILLQTVDSSGNLVSQSAGRPRLISLNQIVELLRQHKGVAYVVLGRRGEQTPVALDKVFVIPDVIKLTIIGTPPPAAAPTEASSTPPPPATGGQPDEQEQAGDQEPEVSVVPGEPGKPPRIKFHFDPEKYVQPESQ
ncbi:MAG: hypothetical protein U1F76_08410 [Candidatus Competibacteraceae bacterium]